MKHRNVFLIGNGKTRKDFDLNKLRGKGLICGCNALYRDFIPDILFANDSGILSEIREANLNIPIITKEEYLGKTLNCVGMFAFKYILNVLQPEKCYLLGIDFLAGNIYTGTKHYRDTDKRIHDKDRLLFTNLLRESKGTEVINVNPYHIIGNRKNYRLIEYSEFENEI